MGLFDLFSVLYGKPKKAERSQDYYSNFTPEFVIECPSCEENLNWKLDFENPDGVDIEVDCGYCGFSEINEFVPGDNNDQ